MGADEKHAATYHGLSDDTVRGRYCDGTHAQTGHTTDGAEYDTWLAGVKAEAKAEAWDEGFFDGRRQDAEGDDGPRFVNPYKENQ